MTLRVYGWIGFRSAAPGHGQTREICAAKSMAECARLAGEKYARHLFNICETGNEEEVKVAMAFPRRVFWRGLDEQHGHYMWRRVKQVKP